VWEVSSDGGLVRIAGVAVTDLDLGSGSEKGTLFERSNEVSVVEPEISGFGGLFLLETAMFLVFIAAYPTAMGFFGIPLWVFGAVFIGIQVLQLTAVRAWEWLLVMVVDIAISFLGARAMGLSSLEWIPRVPLPASLSGDRRSRRHPGSRRSGHRRGPAPVTPIRPVGTAATPTAADLLRQAEIDVLLDKISEHGIDSLSAAERRRLDELSKRMRDDPR